jgi:CHASE2 domain-containing sensor protein/anti-sigma regulatory factor (Ser/Thr protein kinase)
VHLIARRHLREWALLLVLLLAGLLAAVRGGWLERADQALYDAAISASGRAVSDTVLILAIDEPSLAAIGRWPWSRVRLAEVLERLADAGSGPVLLDVILSEPQQDDPAADARLAAAIARHGRVVLPVFMPAGDAPAVRPLPAFAAAARLGHAQALVDSDGVSRRYLPVEHAQRTAYPHVSAWLTPGGAVPATPALAGEAARLVPFAGPPGHFPRVPVIDLLAGRVDPARWRGRTVLLGATATGLGDNLATPLAGVGGSMPGVEFVANIVDGRAAGLQPRELPLLPRMGLSAVVLLGLMLACLPRSPRAALAITGATVLGCVLAAWLGLRLAGWWWPPAAPAVFAALVYPLWSWRRLEASLSTMARETTRIAALARPGAPAASAVLPGGFLDPVESRIQAISQAVDRIADALVVDATAATDGPLREEMMRHVAHDLRSPLVSLRSLAEQLRGGGGGAVDAALLERIDACARRSLDLTEQFLLLGRAQALDATHFGEVDLVQLLHQTADDLWEDAQREGARIVRVCALDLALVQGDARLLQRALMNLAWNALRHGRRGGTVTLSLTADAPSGYTLTVHDEGAGFPPEQLAALTQAYAQGGGDARGFGLGLALVCLVADKHRARTVAFHPQEGGFSIRICFVYD